MTVEELNNVLESHEFEVSSKFRDVRPIFSFKENFIGKNGIKLCKYKLTKINDFFWIQIIEDEERIFADNFKNIILDVKGDNRFPLILNFEGGGLDITLKSVT